MGSLKRKLTNLRAHDKMIIMFSQKYMSQGFVLGGAEKG